MEAILAILRGSRSVKAAHLTVYRRGSLVALAVLLAISVPLTYAVLNGRVEAAFGTVLLSVLTLALLPVATSRHS